MEKIKYFFLKLDHFLSTFCKKCIFTIKNPKNLFFQKLIKLLLDKQIFAFSDARFCHNMCNFSLDMILSP